MSKVRTLPGPRLIECADNNEDALDQLHDRWSDMIDAVSNRAVTLIKATGLKKRLWAHHKTRLDIEDRAPPILQAQGPIATAASQTQSNPKAFRHFPSA